LPVAVGDGSDFVGRYDRCESVFHGDHPEGHAPLVTVGASIHVVCGVWAKKETAQATSRFPYNLKQGPIMRSCFFIV
jgi:hypothetical protein